ncbi:hypothetical protein FA13DRAFT_1457490 [Coprinellus micaceus]|uniref:Uncharacterized protein n=1 Tax=Coprinellus micaceus TaxID=71717 RepID=A0A4Y7SME0_COPMI|nr:hypothetical protein FA13DRAFT_1457490 [Coprinellus micaceus]
MTTPPTTTTLVSPRARVINRLIITSLILNSFILGASMVFLGTLSFFISLVGVAACWAFDITLLTLSGKEQRLAAQTSASDTTIGRPNSYPPLPMVPPLAKPLPCILRKPTIIAAFCIASIWMASVVALIHSVILFDRFKLNRAWIASPALEMIFTIFHIGVLETIGVLAWKERKARIVGSGQLKWYQLGEYQQQE